MAYLIKTKQISVAGIGLHVIYETVVTLGSFLMKLFGIKNKDHIHLLFQLNFLKYVSDCMASVGAE